MTHVRSTDAGAVFLKAARMMSNRSRYAKPLYEGSEKPVFPSCHAVTRAGGDAKALRWYQETMLDSECDVSKLWGPGEEYSEQTYETRVLLLCLAAQVARAP